MAFTCVAEPLGLDPVNHVLHMIPRLRARGLGPFVSAHWGLCGLTLISRHVPTSGVTGL